MTTKVLILGASGMLSSTVFRTFEIVPDDALVINGSLHSRRLPQRAVMQRQTAQS
jgi:hypothetical protein